MVTVLIAEDHPMFRDALQTALELTGRFDVVAAVGSGTDAVDEAIRLTPDVVVMDLEMPEGGGMAATSEILRRLPNTRILVLTSYDEDRLVYAALRVGAGYLLKSATAEQSFARLLRSVRAKDCSPAAWSSASHATWPLVVGPAPKRDARANPAETRNP